MTDLTSERLQELRRIAEAATPGPWEVVGLSGYGGPYALRMPHRSGRTWYGVECIKRREDAKYFAACDPDTILVLLDERDALAAEVERLRAEIKVWEASFEQAASGHATYAEKTNETMVAYARTLRLADEYATLLICNEGQELERGQWKLTDVQVEYSSYLQAAIEHLKWRGLADVTPLNDGLMVDFTKP